MAEYVWVEEIEAKVQFILIVKYIKHYAVYIRYLFIVRYSRACFSRNAALWLSIARSMLACEKKRM